MKKIIAFTLAVACSTIIFAQTDPSLRYAGTITADELKTHVAYLAGPECEGRETGRKGQKVAAEFLVSYFKSLEIPPLANGTYIQSFPLEQEGNDCSLSLTIGGKQISTEEFITFYCGFMPAEVAADDFVFAGYGIGDPKFNDYQSVPVKGKLVVILDGEPMDGDKSLVNPSMEKTNWSTSIQQKVLEAESNGAKAVIVITKDHAGKRNSDNVEALERRFTKSHIPFIYVNESVADAFFSGSGQSVSGIRKEIDTKKKPFALQLKTPVRLSVNKNAEKLTGENVLAYIEGTDLKDELVVITAHYDHLGIHGGEVYYGADDDGSGTAAIMEIAEAFAEAKKNGNGPRRSILIMPVSGEEKGLLGSEYYSNFPVFPLEKTVANLNIDMIGRMDSKHKGNDHYVYLIGSDKLSTQLHTVSEQANTTYTKLELDYTYNDPKDPNMFYYRSDHYNFAKHNIPVIFYFTGVHEDYHKPTDTAEKLDYEKIARISRLVFHTAWELANRDQRVIVDKKSDFDNWR